MKALISKCFVIGTLLSLPCDTSAARPRSQQVQGVIEAVDHGKRELVVRAQNGSHERLVLTSQTKFIRDNQFTSPTKLRPGTEAVVNYRSPFFGEKFATMVRLESQGSK